MINLTYQQLVNMSNDALEERGRGIQAETLQANIASGLRDIDKQILELDMSENDNIISLRDDKTGGLGDFDINALLKLEKKRSDLRIARQYLEGLQSMLFPTASD